MRFGTIRWRIAVPNVVLILCIMMGLAIYLSGFVRQVYLSELRARLLDEARLLQPVFQPALEGREPSATLQTLVDENALSLGTRITVIAADGTVLADSVEDPLRMENNLNRPEVQRALASGQGDAMRLSATVGYEMLYLAIPVKVHDAVAGIVRVALPMSDVGAALARLRRTILLATLAAASLALVLAVMVAERTAEPLRRLTAVVRRMAEGDLEARLFPTTSDEVGTLTRAYNQMANTLRDTIRSLGHERSRLGVVLDHMADGVLITDPEGRVGLINPAAARLLGTGPERAVGRSLAEVARHHEIIALWQECRLTGQEQVDLVELGRHGTFLQVIVTSVQQGPPHGCLLILQDLTNVRRLETIRRDFVSNISHELRTPLASLKALADTLRDGALEDPPAAHRFLDRIEVEVDALTQMTEELLELSRIESGKVPIRLVPVDLSTVVAAAVARLSPQAERADLTVTIDLAPGIPPVLADAERIQQVVTNLLHNAIKFTPAGGTITIAGDAQADEVTVGVRDTGVGIAPEALQRIFERFYKADRARSGRGTGLGLAIAKHLVQAHGGRIWAESVEGRGSTFYFTVPMAGEVAPMART